MSDINEIIAQSSFELIEGTFIYAKVRSIPSFEVFMITKDKDEITVVAEANQIPDLDFVERNKEDYKLIALNVSIPFYTVGFLAKVSQAIAEGGMNILIVSTYSKDYIMVKKDVLDKALGILKRLGFRG